jgi:PKD repeat protein
MTHQFRVLLVTVLVLTFAAATEAQSRRALERRVFPQINLPAISNSEQAIANLGNRLPEVAQWYGMSTAEFARTLREDNSAWIDRHGRLLYIDTFPEPAGEDDSDSLTTVAPLPASQTFLLNSRPGSDRVIYLDFDGHTISGRAWNGGETVVSPPYDRDGDVSNFSSLEIDYIQKMWRQVAEDYAPFDVNVTTQDPGPDAITRSSSADLQFGTRVVITKDNFSGCGCGGYSYLRVFDDVGDYYKPAYVFNTSLVGAGEAISHEAGHNLGLSHDGSATASYYAGHGDGATGWAPIMGVGYYEKLVQWSQGEYTGANQTQDDFQLIQNYGAPLAADDHGNSNASATTLVASGDGINSSISNKGMINQRDDVDVFHFISGAGNYNISVMPAAYSPNLDISAQLFSEQGNLVASSNPISSLAATLTGTGLLAGDYFLMIDGVGEGDKLATGYTDYGSLGHYSISGTVPDGGGLGAPVANISAAPLAGYGPLIVDFDGSASSDSDGTITDYNWDFGDGNSAGGSSNSNVYYAPGSYPASLQVTDDSNLANTTSVIVTVYNQPPYAVATADTAFGEAPTTVNFQGSTSSDPDAPYGNIENWLWDFGDGGSSNQVNPSHTYNTAGEFTPTLTVTDDQGGTDAIALSAISITPSALIDQYAYGDVSGAGSSSGTINNSYYDDGSTQSIVEIISGGKKRSRYSYLEHSWFFSVQPGDLLSLQLNAWHSNSSDGDNMAVDWSIDNGASFQQITILENTYDAGTSSFMLPAGAHGEVQIRLRDTDRTAGHVTTDTLYVDEMFIRSEVSQGGEPPSAPANLSANGATSNAIDLGWTDGTSTEHGYLLARSINGGPWNEQYQTLGQNAESFTDIDLSPATTYIYRVAAYNSAGYSAWSNQGSATTSNAPAGNLSLSVSGYKQRGVQHASLVWSGSSASQVDVYRDLQLVASIADTGSYVDNIGGKGGASYSYVVCEQSTSTCSAAVTLVF